MPRLSVVVRAQPTGSKLPGSTGSSQDDSEYPGFVDGVRIDRPARLAYLYASKAMAVDVWHEVRKKISLELATLTLRVQGPELLRYSKILYKYYAKALAYCDPGNRSRTQRLLRKHAVRFARFHLIEVRARQLIPSLMLLIFIVAVLTRNQPPFLPLMTALVMAATIDRFTRMINGFGRSAVFFAASLLVTIFVKFRYSINLTQLPRYLTMRQAWPATLCWIGITLLAVAVITLLTEIFMVLVFGQILFKRYSEQMVLSALSFALDHLESDSCELAQVKSRKEVIGHLDNAATGMRSAIPVAMRISDPVVDRYVKESCRQAAQEIASLEIRVALSENSIELRRAIARYMELTAFGNYQMLRSHSPLPTEPSVSKVRLITSIMRTLLIACIPITIILSVRYVGVHLEPYFLNWAVAISLAWLAVTLISSLDPQYSARIKAIGAFAAAFRGKNSDG